MKTNPLTPTYNEYDHAHFYDLFSDQGSLQQKDVNFFLSYALRATEALEIGAGTGRVAIPIAEHGIPTWTIEPSPHMRSMAFTKTLYRPHTRPYITILNGDAAGFNLNRQFRFIYSIGLSVHILSDAAHVAVLQNVRRHLAPGGLFVFSLTDIDPQEWYDRPLHVVDSRHIGEVEYRRMHGQEMTSENTCKYRTVYQAIYKGEIIERVENRTEGYFITQQQIRQFLTDTGFSIRSAFADFDFTPFTGRGNQIIIEAVAAG